MLSFAFVVVTVSAILKWTVVPLLAERVAKGRIISVQKTNYLVSTYLKVDGGEYLVIV